METKIQELFKKFAQTKDPDHKYDILTYLSAICSVEEFTPFYYQHVSEITNLYARQSNAS